MRLRACDLSYMSDNNGMEQRDFTTPEGEQVIILAPTGRLDITTAWQFRLKLQEAISEATPYILVNLSEVNFRKAKLSQTDLRSCKLTDTDLGQAQLSQVRRPAN